MGLLVYYIDVQRSRRVGQEQSWGLFGHLNSWLVRMQVNAFNYAFGVTFVTPFFWLIILRLFFNF